MAYLKNLNTRAMENKEKILNINPIMKADYPDPDVIRVGDTYFMVSTTMHFMPGCEILKSYDLIHWEHASYVYETLDGTPGQRLEGDKNIYGQGMWAATIRYHDNKFYVCFVANDTRKTYLYTASNVDGPWEKKIIEGFYHDCSLFFDEDGRVYIVYGNSDIWLTELKKDLSGPLEGGLHRIIVSDKGNTILGYEGSHIYKIDGRYYVFFIHSRKDKWMRTQACFMAESLEGEFTGGDVLEDDRGYCGQGVAQGGIVDTCDGLWYAILFQDHGAVGRIPVLVPVMWENHYPVFGNAGKVPEKITTKNTRPGYVYQPLVGSDDFISSCDKEGVLRLSPRWQFNHEPDSRFYELDATRGGYTITTSKISVNLTQALNTITQRMKFPSCAAEVSVDALDLREGDYAGLCALQGCYGMVAITKREGKYWLVMKRRAAHDDSLMAMETDGSPGNEEEIVPMEGASVRLRAQVDFEQMKDEIIFCYHNGTEFVQIGKPHKLYFKMDHFTGCRFGLFLYATKEVGGKATFHHFTYE